MNDDLLFKSILFYINRGYKLVFDLDNTLYPESDYLFGAYKSICAYAFPLNTQKQELGWQFLKSTFEKQGRKNIFNFFKKEFPESEGDVESWLRILRTHKVEGGIRIYPWALKLICEFPDNCLAILTNGNEEQQFNKIRQLNPTTAIDALKIYCANNFSPKPNPAGLLKICEDFNLKSDSILLIGDSTEDEICSARAGSKFLKIHV